MGACDQNQQVGGVVNGVVCDRSADVWGIALTPRCDVTIAWLVRNNSNKSLKATYATTQTGGRTVCQSAAGTHRRRPAGGKRPSAGGKRPSAGGRHRSAGGHRQGKHSRRPRGRRRHRGFTG
jgi:hypothetical protein